MPRSLKATENGAKQANEAFARRGQTQQVFADLLCISRTTVYKFLHSMVVSTENFINMCEALGLNWTEIADFNNAAAEPINKVEGQCYRTIEQPGEILRIKAPQQMGKATLMGKIVSRARQINYRTTLLFFGELTKDSISSYDEFLLWICQNIGQELEIPNEEIDNYWKTKKLDKNTRFRKYVTDYILPKIESNSALVIGLHDVHVIFKRDFAADFFSMLRSWSDSGKMEPDLWGKLRFVLAHSTEIYLEMDIHRSPFNVGVPITLNEFTREEIKKLASKYGIRLNEESLGKLMKQVGGHPYLVDLVLKEIKYSSNNEYTFVNELLSQESLENICGHYLNELWNQLHEAPKSGLMQQTLKKSLEGQLVLKDDQNQLAFFLLDSMGLVIVDNDGRIKIRNNLYLEYFKKKLKIDINKDN